MNDQSLLSLMTKKKTWSYSDGTGKPCYYCRRTMIPTKHNEDKDPTVRGLVYTHDHILVRSKGGGNEPENLLLACARCNSLRGSISFDIYELFGQQILSQYPDAPTIFLRGALFDFLTALAEIAIRNKRESRQAISLAKSKLERTLSKI